MTTPTPTPTVTLDDDDLVDLTRPTTPARFKLDGDVFAFARKVPIARLAKLMSYQRAMTNFGETQDIEPMLAFFGLVMPDASAQKVRERADSLENPIDHTDLLNVINYMLGKWGLRPTQPSSDSSTTSDGGTSGTTSTDGPPPTAATPEPSTPPSSWTSPITTSVSGALTSSNGN